MNILEELTEILTSLGVKFETGVFTDEQSDELVVIVPLEDTFDAYADNLPTIDRQTVRLAVLSRNNPYDLRDKIVNELLKANFSILNRKYGGFNSDTKHHVMTVEAEGCYKVGSR
jgi:hypothetical protein